MITQKDIANRLGVSPSLVSRVLSGTAVDIGASKETVRRIREEALKLNYRPNAAALTLRGSATRTLGVIVKDFEDPFFGHIIGELQSLARAKDYSLILTGCVPLQPQIDFTSLMKYHLDGVIIVGSDFIPDGLDIFAVTHTPIIQIGAGHSQRGMARVVMDQEFGLEQLISYLMKLGHWDIGYIGNDTPPNIRREQMLRTIIRRHGLAHHSNAFVAVPAHDYHAGYQAMNQLLQRCGELLPTAIVAADDVVAQAGLRALYEKQIRVPHDLSLASIDDIPSARMTIPALTSLRQPIREMIREAFHLLTRALGKSKPQSAEVVVKPELIIRESCASPRVR